MPKIVIFNYNGKSHHNIYTIWLKKQSDYDLTGIKHHLLRFGKPDFYLFVLCLSLN